MVGRRLCSEQEATGRGFCSSDCARRRQVLRETIARFDHASPSDCYHQLAQRNLNRWRDESSASDSGLRVNVYPDDWGEVTRSLSMTHGMCSLF
jgi:hypothetical protein